jgi:UDP-N-acetylmuramoyl-L-alanyl-D-glutamate--2,6-diaminopimelate ligase
MKMLLSAVLSGCRVMHTHGEVNPEVLGITLDSRAVTPGVVFVAIRGLKTDGNRFVPEAIARGAAAIVSALPGEQYPETPWIQVADERAALAVLAANFYDRPAAKLHAIGITGTNGKTTTTCIVEAILNAAGFPCAVFGTIDYRGPGFRLTAERTTPEAPELQALFKRVVDGGWKYAVMEVSSHAVELKRVEGLGFEVAVFTNLTRDHLDLHHDMRSYFLAKKKLFIGLDGTVPRVLVLNMDDPHFHELKAIAPSHVVSYGLNPAADICPIRHTSAADLKGMEVAYKSPLGELQMHTGLLGKPNLYNIGAAIGVAVGLGLPAEAIRQGVDHLKNVPGRFELVQAGQQFRVVVDYAHTDDALTRLLETAREITPGRVIVVFGCGGDRDRTKRPLMGEAAARASDFAVATSDNPRSEDPMAILLEVEPGLRRGGGVSGKTYQMIPDRREAIRVALMEGKPGDTVLLAGKGHESYQIIGNEELPFDDRAVARELLDELATGRNH